MKNESYDEEEDQDGADDESGSACVFILYLKMYI